MSRPDGARDSAEPMTTASADRCVDCDLVLGSSPTARLRRSKRPSSQWRCVKCGVAQLGPEHHAMAGGIGGKIAAAKRTSEEMARQVVLMHAALTPERRSELATIAASRRRAAMPLRFDAHDSASGWRVATGDVFGRLTVTALVRSGEPRGPIRAECSCSCGTVGKLVLLGALVSRATKSCGCLHDECVGSNRRTHGRTETTEFHTWTGMRSRCTNPANKKFERYGGRGIRVCERWASFEAFYEDMGPKPSPAHTINRLDNDGDYEPGNCAWSTVQEQNLNRSDTIYATIGGIRRPAIEWARELGIKPKTVYARISRGRTPEAALLEGGARGHAA